MVEKRRIESAQHRNRVDTGSADPELMYGGEGHLDR